MICDNKKCKNKSFSNIHIHQEGIALTDAKVCRECWSKIWDKNKVKEVIINKDRTFAF